MKKLLLAVFLSSVIFAQNDNARSASQSTTAHRDENRLQGLKRNDGFIPFYWDAKKGALLFELSPQRLNEEFIYFTGLSSGVGSIEMFADRSSVGGSQLCRFVRPGPKALVIAENTRFRAEHGSAELKHSVARSLPTSVLASLPVAAEAGERWVVHADPRVGFFGERFDDFSRTYKESLNQHYIDRWRLEKKDPNAAISEPIRPITFYLDRAIPEPMRSAARRGALWWNQAFEQAGFRNAVVVEDLPEGADPLDVRYPTIQWTNRSGRGWSVGMVQTDPRTGEILHAVVQLDSHRMRTVNNYWSVVS